MSTDIRSLEPETGGFHTLMTPVSVKDRLYREGLRKALVLSLFFNVVLFGLFPKQIDFSGSETGIPPQIEFKAEEIPLTQQTTKAPRPPRPAVPIPTDDEDIPEDLTIEETELIFDEVMPPPPPPPQAALDDEYVFIPYDSPPEPIGGFSSLLQYLEYPEVARMAGVEGRVIVGALIDTGGKTIKTTILQDSGAEVGFEKAAEAAVMQMAWKPALQRDKPVKVWVSVIVRFSLEQSQK